MRENENNKDIKDLQNEEQQAINMGDFSRHMVGSLFDEEKTEETSVANTNTPLDNDEESEKQEGIKKAATPPPYRGMKQADPDEEYARYIEATLRAAREEEERKAAAKEAAIQHREAQLDELSSISKKTPEKKANTTPTPLPQPSTPAAPARGQQQAKQREKATLNMRNILTLGLFVVLVAFCIFIWQILAISNQLSSANSEIALLRAAPNQEQTLLAENAALNSQVAQLQASIDNYRAIIDNQQDQISNPDANGGNNETQAGTTQQQTPSGDPYTTRDAQGRRVYTVRPGDTMWNIAQRTLGDGSRYTEILAANNMTSPAVVVDSTLIIPER